MTRLEKKSKRKALAIKTLVDSGEYSAEYGLNEAERLNDEGRLLDVDYEPLAEYLEEIINRPVEELEEEIEEDPVEENEEEVPEVENAENIENTEENEE